MGTGLKALERVRPGDRFTLPATANNIPQPGNVIAFAVTNVESGLQTFRFKPTSQGGGLPPEQFVSCKFISATAGSGVYLAFGDATLVATTTSNQLLEATDSFQDFQLNPGDTCFRVLGTAATGTLFILFSGR